MTEEKTFRLNNMLTDPQSIEGKQINYFVNIRSFHS